jgi:hypothetical protein
MERAVCRPGEDVTVENPGVDITSVIEIYWIPEERWTPICLDTRVISITFDLSGASGSAVVWWQETRRDGGRRETVLWRRT